MKARITSYQYRPSKSEIIVYYETDDGKADSIDMYPAVEYNSTCSITKEYVSRLMSWVTNQNVDTKHIEDDILQLMSHFIE